MIKVSLNAIHTRKEITEIVQMIRLHLYNQGVHCGAGAIQQEMERENIKPVPSISTIGRILLRYGLTHGRIGFCDGD